MKKYFVLFMLLAAVSMILVGCGKKSSKSAPAVEPTHSAEKPSEKKETEKKADSAEKTEPESDSTKDPFADKPPTADSVLAEMTKAYKEVRSLELVGASKESVVLGSEKQSNSRKVHIYFMRPNKLNYQREGESASEHLIASGQQLVLYNPEEKLYRKIDFKGKLTELPSLASPGINTLNLLEGVDIKKLLQNPKLMPDDKVNGVDTYVIKGTIPAKEGTPAVQTVWIGKEDFLLRKNSIQGKISAEDLKKMSPPNAPAPKGSLQIESILTMTKVASNVNLPAKLFAFTPPAGVKEVKPPVISDKSPLLGKPAPDFTLKGLDGKEISLSSFKGKVVIVQFLVTELAPTAKDLQVLQKLYNKYEDQGLVVLGISMDKDTEAAKKVLAENDVTFPVLHGGDEAGVKVALSYGAVRVPNTAIIGKDGTVRAHFIGSQTQEFFVGELKKVGIE